MFKSRSNVRLKKNYLLNNVARIAGKGEKQIFLGKPVQLQTSYARSISKSHTNLKPDVQKVSGLRGLLGFIDGSTSDQIQKSSILQP